MCVAYPATNAHSESELRKSSTSVRLVLYLEGKLLQGSKATDCFTHIDVEARSAADKQETSKTLRVFWRNTKESVTESREGGMMGE